MGFIAFLTCTRKRSAKGHTVHRFKFQENWGGVWAWMNCEAVGQEEASLTRYRPDLVFGKAMAFNRSNYSHVYLTFGMKNFRIIRKNVAVLQSSSPLLLSVPTPWVRGQLRWTFRFWEAHAWHVISFVIFMVDVMSLESIHLEVSTRQWWKNQRTHLKQSTEINLITNSYECSPQRHS